MRDWSLSPGDPLALTLAADFRLCDPNYVNDQIWELEIGGGPPALALRTTFGLRARIMRIFPRFNLEGQAVTDPSGFSRPVCLRRFYPNFLLLEFSPVSGLDVIAEYWVPDSHTVAGRFTLTNRCSQPLLVLLEVCGQLAPLDGRQALAHEAMQSVNVLSGRTSDLAPLLFLTGGPLPGPGPYPSLSVNLAMLPNDSRSLTWVQTALTDPSESFELARRTAARPWEAELARIERINAAQTVEITTGDPDWDAALALSQKSAFSLFFGPGQSLPCPSFVLARQPDHGYSPRGDGMDYSPLWNGQPPLEAGYIASLLPGAAQLTAGLVRNFLATHSKGGVLDWKPGLGGQRGRWLAAPLLASLSWHSYLRTLDLDFLREIQPRLQAFLQCWFNEPHDRDLDGFPEWDHPLQTGLEDNPAFTVWQTGGQGGEISAAESPALSAMLAREALSLAHIAEELEQPFERERLELRSAELRHLTEQSWDASAVLYHNRDRVTHRCQAGKLLAKQRGPGKLAPGKSFELPMRLLVRVTWKGHAIRRPEISLLGLTGEPSSSECLERTDFQWGAGLAVATSRQLYSRLEEVEISGLEPRDQVSIHIMDFTHEDISLFLPLWAGIPSAQRAQDLVNRTLFAANRFGRPFGIPACAPAVPDPTMDSTCQAVHLPWNALIGEALLTYGMREEAAQLTARLMSAVIQNLKNQRAFFKAYHAETGAGIGERNALQGLAPLGLFLDVLGVEIQSQQRLTLSGKNPFPWPVTVKYRGLTVTRQADQTVVIFPDGQTLTLNDPTDAVVSSDQ